MVWIPVTLVAATFQILRTSRQHHLRHVLGPTGAGYVRYLYGAPLALAVAGAWFGLGGRTVPGPTGPFWFAITAGGLAQIGGTIALLQSFRRRDFAVGTVYSKTEVIQVAVIAAVVLDEPLRPLGWVGAAVCTLGVAWLAGRGSLGAIVRRAGDPAAVLGIVAGGLFGLASIGIRGASTSLGDAPVLDRAMLTLVAMLTIQCLLNGAYLLATDRPELVRTVRQWRLAAPVGLLSLGGTAGWTIAMTLENAAKVRTLGQVELLLAFWIGWRHHAERHGTAELAASGVVLAGVVAVTALG
ncbi:MAG: EamA family transporter [Acidimicrobiales bacterium]